MAGMALAAGLVISFPNFQFGLGSDINPRGSFYALAAAGLWGLATVVGKSILEKLSPSVVTFWRYAFGFITLVIVLFGTNGSLGLKEIGGNLDASAWRALVYIAIGPGLIAMLLYYKGMTKASAMTTTFMELLFPITAVAINTFYLDQPLNPVQAGAAAVLLFAVTMISLGERRTPAP